MRHWLQRHGRWLTVAGLAVLAAAAVAWMWLFLRPDTWRFYSDQIGLRRLAKDVQPRFVLWEKPATMAGLPADIGEPALSPDGTTLVFVRGGDLFACRWDGKSWGAAAPLRALNSPFQENGPCFSSDGQFVFFSTDRPGGRGGFDIWVARWDGAEFAWPLPLPVAVNSRFDEVAPAYSPRDHRLYFASNRLRKVMSRAEEKMAAEDFRQRAVGTDFDLFAAQQIPAGVTNNEIERALSMLYSLRESALGNTNVMAKLGGTADSEAAVERALVYLASQQETNGSWNIAKSGGQPGHDVAATSFALLTFLGRGVRHDAESPYQQVVANGLTWLTNQQNRATGDLRGGGKTGRPANNAMYDHCAATLALTEAYGITKDIEFYQAAQWAVDYLVDAQNPDDGGWRYKPRDPGDMSVSGWAILALKSAEMSGLHVPRRTMDGIRKWLQSVNHGEQGDLYAYMPNSRSGSDAMTATGYFCSLLMGMSPNTPRAFATARFMRAGDRLQFADLYYAYYGTLAANQNQGPLWREWRAKMTPAFLAAQQPDGSWQIQDSHGKATGRVIGTALVALCLEAHYRYTPLYGLGYEPPVNPSQFAALSANELPPVPEFREARRLDEINSDADDTDPAISPHGDHLYFASRRTGNFDLYRTRVATGEPQGVANLGAPINTPGNERAPALRMNGFDLLFATDAGLRSSLSRRVYPEYDYGKKPDWAWFADTFRVRLGALVVALGALVWLRRRWQALLPVVVIAGIVLAMFLELRRTAWCRYTDGITINVPALEAKPRLVLWDDPQLALTDADLPVFLPDDAGLVFSRGTNQLAASWTGLAWTNAVPTNNVALPAPVLTPRGDLAYFAADKPGGRGGLDLYTARIRNGAQLPAENAGDELNSPADESAPAVRMQGFDLLFKSTRGGVPGLYGSASREVVADLDLSRWFKFTTLLSRLKWWLLILAAAVAALIYLARHYRDLTSLFHKCLALSVAVHAVILLLMALWIISSELVGGREPKTMEISLNVDALAQEKLALNMREEVVELPPADVSLVVEQTRAAVEMPAFTPPRPAEIKAPTIQRTKEESLVTFVTPSAATEGARELPAMKNLDQPLERPRPVIEVALETPTPVPAEKPAEPVEDAPRIEQAQVAVKVEFKPAKLPSAKPVATEVSPAEVTGRVVTNTVATTVRTRDTGGKRAVASAGLEAPGQAPALKGAGEIAGLMVKHAGDDGSRVRMNAPGALDVPKAEGASVSPQVLANPGKLSTEIIEALGGSGLTQGAIGNALEWFTRHQEADGRWDVAKHGGKKGHDVAGTALALLCYYGWGAKHNADGQYREVVNKALTWLLGQMQPDGRFAGNMYDQGIATIVLCEAFGLTKDEKLREPATKAVAYIEKAQHPQTGGWRYKPGDEGDMSVFGWQYLALRSAEMAGIPVAAQTWQRTEVWLKRVAGGQQGGLYGYQGPSGGGPAMTPSGMFCRQLAKVPPTDPRMLEGANYLKVTSPFDSKRKQEAVDYYYLYYGTLALYQHQGPIWQAWNDRMKELLVPMQENQGDAAGSWPPNSRSHMQAGGRVASTAMGTLSLEVYYRLLPIYGFGNTPAKQP